MTGPESCYHHRPGASRFSRPEEAFEGLRSGSRVFIEGGVGHPDSLIEPLMQKAARVGEISIVTSLLGANPPYVGDELADRFKVTSFRGTTQSRSAILAGQVDIVPANLSSIPYLLSGPLRPDIALLQVSLPDANGLCSLGANLLYNKSAITSATVKVAEVNPQMPWTYGNSLVPISAFDFAVLGDHPLPNAPVTEPTGAELKLAEMVVELIPDGATIQMGIGSLPEAIAGKLCGLSNIRLHSGLLSDSVLAIAESGALRRGPASIVSGSFYGSRNLYDFIHRNPQVSLQTVEHTHSAEVIRDLQPFFSINGALEVDLGGQANSEVLGGIPVSGAGGQGDFIRSALACEAGRSVVVLTSTTRDGRHSKIVRSLSYPGVVTSARADADLVVTEFGVAELRGKGLNRRREALLSIAHPDFIPLLSKEGIQP